MGDPFFDLGNFSINHELTPAEDEILLAAYDGSVRSDRLARLTLMRIVSDFREAMWGVLQQGVSTLDVDFVAYATGSFDRLLANAADPRFERALVEVAADLIRRVGSPADPRRLRATLSPMTDPSPPGSPARGIALGIVAFVATLILLFGLVNLVGTTGDRGTAVASAGPSVAPPTVAAASPRRLPRVPRPPVPARRARHHRPRRRPPPAPRPRHRRPTRSWSAPGTSPTARSTTTARPPTWSPRSPARSSPPATTPIRTARPTSSAIATGRPGAVSSTGRGRQPGNHDWETKDLAGYVGYFGTAAEPNGVSWYSYDLGTWHVVVLDSDCSSVGGCGRGFGRRVDG